MTLSDAEYDATYGACLLICIGYYAYSRLSPQQQAQVESEIDQIIDGQPDPKPVWRRWATWQLTGALRSMAMGRLGIEPLEGDPSLSKLLIPYKAYERVKGRMTLGFADYRAPSIIGTYRPIGPPTSDAKAFLRSRGLDVPDIDPKNEDRWFNGSVLGSY